MGEQRNLTEENVDHLRAELEMMKKDNPELEYNFFRQETKEHLEKDDQPSNKKIFEKLETIERKLNLIFSNHVLIDGTWLDTTAKG